MTFETAAEMKSRDYNYRGGGPDRDLTQIQILYSPTFDANSYLPDPTSSTR